MIMVISERLKRVAFYCRMNPRNNDYTQFLEPIAEKLNEHFGKDKWEMKLYFEIASGVAPDRAEFLKLQAEIKAGAWDVVITRRASVTDVLSQIKSIFQKCRGWEFGQKKKASQDLTYRCHLILDRAGV